MIQYKISDALNNRNQLLGLVEYGTENVVD